MPVRVIAVIHICTMYIVSVSLIYYKAKIITRFLKHTIIPYRSRLNIWLLTTEIENFNICILRTKLNIAFLFRQLLYFKNKHISNDST